MKNNQINVSSNSEQTQRIREKINIKIKELGDKYFQVKALFDRLNLRRDHLFYKGKELEQIYKDKKKGIHLQTQCCRMKEALYCWYAEHFYKEIFEMGPYLVCFLQNETTPSDNQKKSAKKTTNIKNNEAVKPNHSEVKQIKKNNIIKPTPNYNPKPISNNTNENNFYNSQLPVPEIFEDMILGKHQVAIKEVKQQEEQNDGLTSPQMQLNPMFSDSISTNEKEYSCFDLFFPNSNNNIDDNDVMSQINGDYYDF